MLPLANIYTLVGPDSKKPITYSLAYGLASNLEKEVILIDSGNKLTVESPFDNLTIIDGKGLDGSKSSLRVMNQLVENYSSNKVFVLNTPYEFLQHVYDVNNRSRFIGFLSLIPGLISKKYRSRARFVFDEQRVYHKAVPLITEFKVPDGLKRKEKKRLKQGWFKNKTEGITLDSLMIQVLPTDQAFLRTIKETRYNEQLAFQSNILPYCLFTDTINESLRKYFICGKNPILERLIEDNFAEPTYEKIKVDMSDESIDSIIKISNQLVSKESLKPLIGLDSFLIKNY